MFHILLIVLKIIGIILLVLLGILFLVFGCVLYAPIHYKGDFSYQDAPKAVLKIRWLFPLIYGTVEYEKDTRIILRALGIPFYDSSRKKNKEKQDEDKESLKAEKEKGKLKAKSEIKSEKKHSNKKELDKKEVTEDKMMSENHKISDEEDQKEEKERINILDFFKNIIYTLKGIYDKLKKGKETVTYYIDVWKSDEMTSARSLIWSQVLYLLRALKPGKMKGYLEFGFEDPSMTGYGMAVYGIFYSVWGNTVVVKPDFENACIQADLWIKGKIRTIYLVKVFLKLYFNQDIRKTISLIKKEK